MRSLTKFIISIILVLTSFVLIIFIKTNEESTKYDINIGLYNFNLEGYYWEYEFASIDKDIINITITNNRITISPIKDGVEQVKFKLTNKGNIYTTLSLTFKVYNSIITYTENYSDYRAILKIMNYDNEKLNIEKSMRSYYYDVRQNDIVKINNKKAYIIAIMENDKLSDNIFAVDYNYNIYRKVNNKWKTIG